MLYARPLWLMVDRFNFFFALLPPSIFLIYFALFLKIDFEFEPSTTFMVTVATGNVFLLRRTFPLAC